MYKYRASDKQVLSYYSRDGYELNSYTRKIHPFDLGYYLYRRGVKSFMSIAELEKLAKLNAEKEEMNRIINGQGGAVLKSGNWIVGSLTKSTNVFSTSTAPAIHLSLAAARQEAARLAGLDKTKKYVVLKVDGIATVQDVNWE